MAFDSFLELTGIESESKDKAHRNAIEVLTWHHEITQEGRADQASRESHHGDFVITKTVDKASPQLAIACCDGTRIQKATLEVCRATGKKTKYMEITLHKAVIGRYKLLADCQGASGLPTEEIALRYSKIQWHYIQTDEESGRALGHVQSTYDLEAARSG